MNIDEILKNDNGAIKRDQLITSIDRQHTELKSSMDKGVSPDEFLKTAAVLSALRSATSMVHLLWKKHH